MVYQDIDGKDIKYSIHNSNKPLEVINGKLELSNYNMANGVLWIAFGVLCLIAVILHIAAISKEAECVWDWDDSFNYALEWFTKCYKEGDEYYYYAFGKLLEKSNYYKESITTGSLRRLKMRPNYEPTEEKRDRLIKKILNNEI